MTQALLVQKRRANEQVFQVLFDSDEVTWKQIIFGLIESEQMDPWNIDISLIAKKFLEMLKTLKEMDFRIGGKIVLASAILLKMKSTKLMEEEINALDQLISSAEEPVDMDFFEEFPIDSSILTGATPLKQERPRLVPRTPQPRKRKVSVYDLVEALEKALELDAQRVHQQPKLIKEARVPKDHVDMSALIRSVYDKVNTHYKQKSERLTFEDLIFGEEKEEKVLTFIPLLHLDFQRKVEVKQKQHFGTIHIDLLQADAQFSEGELKAA